MPNAASSKKKLVVRPKPKVKHLRPAKKTVARKTKAAASTTTRTTARKAVKRRPKPKKTAAKKTTAKKPGTSYDTFNVHGFRVGSDQAIIVDALVKGGFDRGDVVAKATKSLPTTVTRNDRVKNVSSLVSALLSRLTSEGYKVESSWRLVPPKRVQNKMEKQSAS